MMTKATPPDPEGLPPVFPVQVASRVLGIGKNQTYDLIKAERYPVRVLQINGRFKVTRYDLLAYLGAPGHVPASQQGEPEDGALRALPTSRGDLS